MKQMARTQRFSEFSWVLTLYGEVDKLNYTNKMSLLNICHSIIGTSGLLTEEQYNYTIIMKIISFEFDENKNQINIKKHGISFEKAISVFFDDNAILFDDPEHSLGEERFLLLGMSSSARTCIICHCYRHNEMIIRIISARKATKKEAQRYVKGI